MRLFVAIDISDALRDAIESDVVGALREASPGARWTRPEGRHLTLQFLGNVADELLGEIGDALRPVASRVAPFEASFAELGGFPNLRRPRVLWIGIGKGSEQMSELAAAVGSALEPLGFAPEDRPFRGHLTLARFKQPKNIHLPEIAIPTSRFPASEIVLFQTLLHPKGARYAPMERFSLESGTGVV